VNVPENALIGRGRYLKDAKESSFLDAVFLIHFYNRYAKWGGCADIAPAEVFGAINPAEYQVALARVSRLLTHNLDVGMARHRYPGARPYEEEFALFKA
jgi:hypothetical protein